MAVAQVVHADGRPTMLLSTAAVHSGASGGALVSRQGRLLGLVTSNARCVHACTLLLLLLLLLLLVQLCVERWPG